MSTTHREMATGRDDLEQIKRRRRLENLLYTRRRLTQLAAEHRSHQLDDAVDLYLLQLETEQVIADEFPDEFEVRVGSWAEEEAAGEHHPASTSAGCSLCEAVARADAGWFQPPRAA